MARKKTGIISQTIASWIPDKMLYFCVVRVWAKMTTGEWSNTDATTLTVDRWNRANRLNLK